MRFYGFNADELTTATNPELDLTIDPKLAWALRHRGQFPVDINRAPREALLRIPGLGVRNVNRILHLRRFRKLRLGDLIKLKVSLKKAKPFILTADYNADAHLIDRQELPGRVITIDPQLMLFETITSARTGEV